MRVHRIAAAFAIGVWLPLLAVARTADAEKSLRTELARKILDVSFKQDVLDRMMQAMDRQIGKIAESAAARAAEPASLEDYIRSAK